MRKLDSKLLFNPQRTSWKSVRKLTDPYSTWEREFRPKGKSHLIYKIALTSIGLLTLGGYIMNNYFLN